MSANVYSTDNPPPPVNRPGFLVRLRVAASLLAGLRKPDFQAGGTYRQMRFGHFAPITRWWRFLAWTFYQIFVAIPNGTRGLTIARHVSNCPMWLLDTNPLADHPWCRYPDASLPKSTDTVVIGAGFTGGALAYHWARRAPHDREMVVLDMGDPASGSSGRNEGLVVMGRYFTMVKKCVLNALPRQHPDLDASERQRLACQFAEVYARAAYRNAALIEKAIREEGFDCDYARDGWVQTRTAEEQATLDDSVREAKETGFDDWTKISAEEALRLSGMRLDHPAGFSQQAASWHPAKWVWSLFGRALASETVSLFTRTRVTSVATEKDHYRVETSRGRILARHVVYATEAYTPALEKTLHDAILPMQEQAACGDGGPESMKPYIGISGAWFFAGRYGRRVLFGSGGSRLPDHEAGRNRPSRFLSRFVVSEMRSVFGNYRLHMTNEWSGTVGYTPDQYPIVGSVDGRGRHIVAGMCGSGSSVSFNGGRCIVNRILSLDDEPDDYPAAYFSPSRLLDTANHAWPTIEA